MKDRIDLYEPADGARRAAVILVAGYPDAGFERIVGCKFKEMPSNVAWARRIAEAGLVAIAYSNREPVADLHAVLRYVREELGIERVGLWAASGNAPLALSALREAQCAALLYPYTIDVPDEAKKFGFVTPEAELPDGVPLMLVRAGADAMPGLNETIVRFVRLALECDLPLTLVNHPRKPHAFDVAEGVIAEVIEFLARQLGAAGGKVSPGAP